MKIFISIKVFLKECYTITRFTNLVVLGNTFSLARGFGEGVESFFDEP